MGEATTGATVTAAQIDAGDLAWRRLLSQTQKDEMIVWLGQQGVPEPGRAVRVQYLVVDAPIINVTHHARNENNRIMVAGDTIMESSRDYLVLTPLPDWWRPVGGSR